MCTSSSAVARADDVPVRQQQLAAIRLDGGNPSVSIVVDLDPVGTIHETLRHLGCAVACLASHGRHRGPTLRPSVASEVIARGHDSVMLAGPMIGRPRGVWWSDAQLSLARRFAAVAWWPVWMERLPRIR